MKILSQNVNGIRARIKQGFEKTIDELRPDIICIQEFRARENQLPSNFLTEYNHFHSIWSFLLLTDIYLCLYK